MENQSTHKKRLRYLDFIRGIAVFLVLYGHLVDVSTYAPSIPDVINEINNVNLPMIGVDTHKLYLFSSFLFNSASIQTAVVGVFLFFLLTGCLIPDSLERYPNPLSFLLNRFLRIFPTFWACLIVLCIVVYAFQGISFSMTRIIATMAMMHKMLGIPTISGVLWTLSIELFFYVLCAIVRKFTFRNIYFILLVTLVMIYLCPSGNYHLDGIITDLKWVSIILCGVTFNLVQREFKAGNVKAIFHMIFVIIISFTCFNVYVHTFGDDTTYPHMSTWIFAFAIFYFAVFINSCMPEFFDKKIFLPLYKIAELCFPIYILHVAVGLSIMYQLRIMGLAPILLPFIGAAISIFLAQCISWIIEKPSMHLSKLVLRHIK